jgi:hypothetical protein
LVAIEALRLVLRLFKAELRLFIVVLMLIKDALMSELTLESNVFRVDTDACVERLKEMSPELRFCRANAVVDVLNVIAV